jgi:ABC-2 type transport system permease protein
MRLALHAEWTKLRTLPGTGWLLLMAVAVTVGLGAAAVAGTTYADGGSDQDPVRLGLVGVQLGQAVVAVLAVLVLGGEYATGMIRTTLAAVPGRWTLVGAKATIVAGTVVVPATAGVLGSLLVARLLLPGQGFTATNGFPPLSLADGATLRAAAGSVLYLVLIALLALGITAMVRDSAAAAGVVLGLLYLFPIVVTAVSDPDWQRHLKQAGPMTAGLSVQATRHLDSLPIGPWAGLGVLAAWTAGALLCGGLALRLRDA